MPDWAWVAIVIASSVITYLVAGWRADADATPPDDAKPEPDAKVPSTPAPRAATPVPSAPAAKTPISGTVSAHPSSGTTTVQAPAPSAPAGEITVTSSENVQAADGSWKRVSLNLPKVNYEEEEDEDVDPTVVGPKPVKKSTSGISPPTKRIVYDDDAEPDEPTHAGDLILLTATAQTDKGHRRKRNEDSLLVSKDSSLFVVADGMGGYNGGEIASALAVETIAAAFETGTFAGDAHEGIPWRASELARAIQMANEAILERASADPKLQGMGTTICAARFAPRKMRLYIGHVGDSRMYRLRGGTLEQLTKDHTMRDFGVTGDGSGHLSRAVGVWPTVPIDIIIGKPLPGDVYVLCSDGLTKMLPDAELRKVLVGGAQSTPDEVAQALVAKANAAGGKDNITVILIQVRDAVGSLVAGSKRRTA